MSASMKAWLRDKRRRCALLLLLTATLLCPVPSMAQTGQDSNFIQPVPFERVEPAQANSGQSTRRDQGPFGPADELLGQVVGLIDFRDLTLADAMQVLSQQTDLNIVYTPDAGAKTLRVYLTNVTALQAIESITQANDLYYRIDPESGIIRISTTEEYRRDIASFRDDQTRVFTLLYPNPTTVALSIRNLYGNRVRMSIADQLTDRLDFNSLQERLDRFDLLDTRSLGLGIIGNGFGNQFGLGFGGGGLNRGLGGGVGGIGGIAGGGFARNQIGNQFGLGGGIGGLQGFGNQFGFGGGMFGGQNQNMSNEYDPIEGLTAEQIQALTNLENDEGAIPPETLSLLMNREQASIFVTVVQRNNQIVVRTGDRDTMEQIESLIRNLDVPTPTVLLEVKIMRVELEDGFESAFDYQFSDASKVAGGFSDGNIQPPVSDLLTGDLRRAASLALGGSGLNPGALAFQYVDESVRTRLQLLETKNRVTVLSAPLIMTANNEVSRIFVGDTLPFTVGFTAPQIVTGVNANNTVAGTPITELRDVGQSLLITPNINADRSVTLRIVEENSRRLEDGATIPVPDTLGNITDQPVDTVQRQTVSGTIIAQDGLAVVLGGLIEEVVADRREQVPVLGKVPGLGFFFRRQASGRDRSELVIMIRPYVFNTPAEAAAVSQELMCDLSLHPNAPDGGGTLNTFNPNEVMRAVPPLEPGRPIFQFHTLTPKVY